MILSVTYLQELYPENVSFVQIVIVFFQNDWKQMHQRFKKKKGGLLDVLSGSTW